MFTSKIKHKGMACIVAMLCAGMLVACGLSACSVQTNSKVDNTLTPKLEEGATISKGYLTVGINTLDPPFGGTSSNNEPVGLDVDVAAAIAQELGLKLQIVDVNSSGRNALNNAQVDVALGLTKSGTSEKVSYSAPYLNDGLSLFCLSANKPSSLENAAEKIKAGEAKVIVQADTTAALKAQELFGVEKLSIVPTMQSAFDNLAKGTEKYLITDASVGDYFARNYSDVIRYDFLGADCVTPMYAVTLSDKTAVSNAVNAAVKTINGNGVMRVIAAKWLGSDATTLLNGKTNISALPAKAFGM